MPTVRPEYDSSHGGGPGGWSAIGFAFAVAGAFLVVYIIVAGLVKACTKSSEPAGLPENPETLYAEQDQSAVVLSTYRGAPIDLRRPEPARLKEIDRPPQMGIGYW